MPTYAASLHPGNLEAIDPGANSKQTEARRAVLLPFCTVAIPTSFDQAFPVFYRIVLKFQLRHTATSTRNAEENYFQDQVHSRAIVALLVTDQYLQLWFLKVLHKTQPFFESRNSAEIIIIINNNNNCSMVWASPQTKMIIKTFWSGSIKSSFDFDLKGNQGHQCTELSEKTLIWWWRGLFLDLISSER